MSKRENLMLKYLDDLAGGRGRGKKKDANVVFIIIIIHQQLNKSGLENDVDDYDPGVDNQGGGNGK